MSKARELIESVVQGASPRGVLEGLGDADKRVIRAFLEHQKATGKLLDTDGITLDKMGLGGGVWAKWEGGFVRVVSTMSVKSDEMILRALKDQIPTSWLKTECRG